MREKAVSWRTARSLPFFVYFAARRKRRVTAGLRAVFLMNRPTGSEVRPGVVSLVERGRGRGGRTFAGEPAVVHRHDGG